MGTIELGLVLGVKRGRLVGRRQERGEVVRSAVSYTTRLWVVPVGEGYVAQRGIEVHPGHQHPAAGQTPVILAQRLPDGWSVEEGPTGVLATSPEGSRHQAILVHPQVVATLAIANAQAVRNDRRAQGAHRGLTNQSS